MKIEVEQLIQALVKQTESFVLQAREWQKLPLAKLNFRSKEGSWSVLECMEHLNLYGDFYIPEITQQIQSTPHRQAAVLFVSGRMGNYFAESMRPKAKLNKMSTFKDKNPIGSTLDKSVIDRFIDQQQALLQLLYQAREVDLTKTKTKCTLPLIKFRLGDTFRFVIYHNHRHIVQAQNILK